MMYRASAKEIRDRFVRGDVSAEEVTRYFLGRIERWNPELGAFISVFPERALEKARQLDRLRATGHPLGLLAGVPVGLKDNLHVRGEITTCASRFLRNYRADFDASVTQFMESEGAIILGKLNLDEFAMGSSTEYSAIQPTSNPWDLNRVPGGSSGGAAAAIAAGLCTIALGSETGGSVRHPAAFCGCYGFKPTYGRVSRYGLVAFASSLDQVGPLARSIEDIGLAMGAIGRHDPRDATSLPTASEDPRSYTEPVQQKTLGVPWHLIKTMEPEAQLRFQEALRVYESLGFRLQEINLQLADTAVAVYYVLANAEAATNLARFDGIRFGHRSDRAKTLDEVYSFSRSEGFGPEVKRRILIGTYILSSGYRGSYYTQALRIRDRMQREYAELFQRCDAVITPTTASSAFLKGDIQDPLTMSLQDLFTIPACLCHLPAISHPIGTVRGLPFSLQLTGPCGADADICRMATSYARVTPPIPFAPRYDRETL